MSSTSNYTLASVNDWPDCFNSWNWKTGAAALGVVLLTGVAVRKLTSNRKRHEFKRDVVILHQFPRGNFTPNLSPFPIKVETYLRMAKIPYETSYDTPMGPKGKCPWIMYNDDTIADSSFCIDYMNKKFDINLDAHLSEEQKAIAYSFKVMVEEYLVWCLIMERYIYDRMKSVSHIGGMRGKYGLPLSFFIPIIERYFKRSTYYQGIGRHSKEEVEAIAEKIIKALSVHLGKKPFFMGNEASEVDCAIFGFMVQLVWNAPGSPAEKLVKEKYTNLKDYTMRMKDAFWQDWDQLQAVNN